MAGIIKAIEIINNLSGTDYAKSVSALILARLDILGAKEFQIEQHEEYIIIHGKKKETIAQIGVIDRSNAFDMFLQEANGDLKAECFNVSLDAVLAILKDFRFV